MRGFKPLRQWNFKHNLAKNYADPTAVVSARPLFRDGQHAT